MDGFSILDGSWLEPLANQREYNIGNAIGWLSRDEKQAAINHSLAGRLYVAKSGWLLLSVPNALVRGVYDALATPGAELPRAGLLNVPNVPGDVLNAHISVMNADEVKKIGAENINERGHMFGYSLGHLKEITPRNIAGISKVWALQVSAPMLSAIRKSYGLDPLLNGHQFHITVAVRRKSVLNNNAVSKAAMAAEKQHSNALSRSGQKDLLPGGKADNLPDREFSSSELAEGAEHEHEHTNNDQVAKEIAKDHLQEDSQYYEKVEAIEGKEAASSVMPMPPKPKEAPPAETAPPEMPPPVVNDVSFGVVPPPALPPSGQQLPDPTKQQEDEQKQAEDIKRVLKDLRAAKAHSDNKRYDQKTQILRRLMEQSPHDWKIDDPKPYHKGITHKNTNFRFHVEPTAIPESVKAAYRQPRSAYMTSLYNSYGLHRPLRYNYDKTVAENIQEQLMEVKRRGDFMRAAKQNHQRYMAALDPKYRYELAMKAMNNEMEEEPMVDRVIGQYGDSFINTVFGRPK